AELLGGVGVETPVGVLFDFGVSSRQIDDSARGFSFRHRGPLDMRMDPGIGLTAYTIVNEMPIVDLARLIRKYGEEPAADRIAAAIVRARPLTDTVSLAEVIGAAVPGPRRRGHPARRTFQALRMAVNDELAAIEAGLDQALDLLAVNGRCVTIAYHSLEDRLVKQKFAAASAGCVCPPELPICGCGVSPRFRLLTRGAGKPSPDEVASNPRARSARLRAVARVAA
ncbi:MAG TPA: 16S rRNA (cytosine(1402)-N(4))-methyltransferase RsmH, partial [Acidimicrobiia bacterium]|nr:16S rRNA (cytosine(1402)-N(4))-methyltransferase RsmH [Acidimicrobiia bacterium]